MSRVVAGEEGALTGAPGTAGYRSPWYWTLTGDGVHGIEVFTERTPSDEVLLPVFESAEDARAYLRDRRGRWRPRQTGRGELVSILMGVCREAGWVALEPPPSMATEETLTLLSISRERFLEYLLGRERHMSVEQSRVRRLRTQTAGPRARAAKKRAVGATNAL